MKAALSGLLSGYSAGCENETVYDLLPQDESARDEILAVLCNL